MSRLQLLVLLFSLDLSAQEIAPLSNPPALSQQDQIALLQTVDDLKEHFSSLLNNVARIQIGPPSQSLELNAGESQILRVPQKALWHKSDLSSYMASLEKELFPETPEDLRPRFQFLIPSREYPTLYYLLLRELAQIIWHDYKVEQFELNDFINKFTFRALAHKKGNIFRVFWPDGSIEDLLVNTQDSKFKDQYVYIDDLLEKIVQKN